jgi:hypothetical protein
MDASLSTLSKALDVMPCVFQGNPLNLLFVDAFEVVRETDDYVRQLASPQLMQEQRELLLETPLGQAFYHTSFPKRPDPSDVSAMLFTRFDELDAFLLSQDDIAAHLAQRVAQTAPDVVIYVVADGLSYYDLPDSPDTQPCFVKGPSITPHGYQAAIGKPSLSRRLFNNGYVKQSAYTYFDVDSNDLAGKLHSTFGTGQVQRVREFKDIIDHVKQILGHSKTYLQVTTTALDGLCHNHRDRPPVEAYKQKLLDNFNALIEVCSQNDRRVMACLTADHGILWRDVVDFEVIDAPTADQTTHPRYLTGSRLREYATTVRSDLGVYSLLRAPCVSRQLRSNEWGVHGGISAWESLVPLKIVTT